jgi:hypothetical protein
MRFDWRASLADVPFAGTAGTVKAITRDATTGAGPNTRGSLAGGAAGNIRARFT